MRTLIALATAAWLFVLPASAATVDGIDVHWTSAGSGPALIFVHGWTCDATSWEAQVPAFAQKYRVITLDLPGHGHSGSPKDGRYSMDLFARAVEAVRSEAKIDKAVLIGHSMGTPVIRQYALTYPQHVTALVLVDGLVLVADPGAPAAPITNVTGPEGLKTRENMIRGMFGPSATPAIQQRIMTMMMAPPEAAAQGAMTATWDRSAWRNDPIAVPVLGIYADRSRIGSNREGLKRLYPSIDYHEIPGTGHFVMMEKPQEFNDLLRRFLARLDD